MKTKSKLLKSSPRASARAAKPRAMHERTQLVFQALGDPTRRALLEKLTEGPLTLSHLTKPLKITLAAVVQHVQLLEESGLVQTEKIGRVRTCRAARPGLIIAASWLQARQK